MDEYDGTHVRMYIHLQVVNATVVICYACMSQCSCNIKLHLVGVATTYVGVAELHSNDTETCIQ